jgi:NADH-quinone oxidoreductase subunit F
MATETLTVSRVLPAEPRTTLDAYVTAGGGRGLEAARALGPEAVIAQVEAAGLRGRGGGGFPTGTKWRTVAGYAAGSMPAVVVVNGAEGEPGTFKDHAIMRANPFAVVEGALIAAFAIGADRVVIAVKETFGRERELLEKAIAEVSAAGWSQDVAIAVATGPSEYLFGEETALLEVLDGRPPFPRIAPPYRQGVDEVGPDPAEPAGTEMAEEDRAGAAPPALANNVETMANVPGILAEGAAWFRSLGTAESPGTIVCTITGASRAHGVAEVAMGTSLADVIDAVGGGAAEGRTLVAAMSGVANPLLPAARFDTPLTYEAMRAAGSGLGAAGFIVFDDTTDLAAVAAGVSRFLAVESCGQCTPCKQDGLALAALLDRIRRSDAHELDLVAVGDRVATVADSARCFLAEEHQLVLESILQLFPDVLRSHARGDTAGAEPYPIAAIAELGEDGLAVLEERQLDKQPDWSFDATDSGKAPVERLAHGGPDAGP